jgi:hypothetical protein
MTRNVKTILKTIVFAGLAVVFCTKLPSDMDMLKLNIGETSLVSPADGSTDIILSPRLEWETVAGATGYRVQVSPASDFSTIAFEDAAVPDTFKIASGLKYKTMYYWRVQVHDAASASEWTMHRIFTTIIEPQIPAVVFPNDTAKDQPATLKLVWNSAVGAASYFVQVASDTGFVTIVAVDSTLADTSKTVSNLSNSSTYYWRVRSRNPGGSSAWTAMRMFTTIVAAPKAPGLVVPASGAANQQLSLALKWNNVPEASSYYLQVSTDIAFTNIFIQDSALTDTSKSIAGLANGVMYYWRVKAENGGGASAWSTFFGFTTFAAVPQQPALNFPADGSADQTIPLTLIWKKAIGAATYHLQIATDSGFAATFLVDSAVVDTSKSVGGLANNTKYFWRVRAKNPVGVSSWSLRRNFVTFAAALQAPVLRSPADGTGGQPVAPVLRWQRVSGALKYRIQISVNSDFSTISSQDSGLTDTSKTLSALANNTVYFWRVRAENATGFSNWATPWYFTTILAAPQVPSLVSPVDAATGLQLSLVLTWNKAAGAATYSVQVASDTGFSTGIIAADSLLTDTTKPIVVPQNNATYYWRVGSKNAIGGSGWSGRRSFTTFAATLALPMLTSPQDGSKDLSLTPTLSWSTAAGATTYKVQVSTVRDFTTVFIDDATLSSGSKTLTGLLNSTTYFWRVMAKNLSGAASNWTDPWSFTTVITTPGTPVLVSPIENAVNQPVSLKLIWGATTGSVSYFVQVASDTGFSNIVSSDSTTTDTAKSISGLSNSVTYYWRVKGKNASGYGSWCVYRTFSTIIAAPMRPVLSSPQDSAANVDLNPQMSWNAVTGADSYHIQVSTASDFSTGLVVNDSTYTQTTKAIGPLLNNTHYYWQVQTRNAGGTSGWSVRRSFTTLPVAPSVAPTPLAPVNNVMIVDLNPPLCWSASPRATRYHLQVATTSSFSGGIVFIDDSTLTDTTKAIGPLTPNVSYCWHVKAKNAVGSSGWSTTGNFTVLGKPAAPVLRSPADLAMNVKLVQKLAWNVSVGATGYHVQAGTSNVFDSGNILDDSTLTDTTAIIGSLTPGILYFWHVKAKNAAGPSDWSSNFSFTTFAIPGVPSLISPADNKTNEPLATTLSVSWAAGTNKYRIQVSTHQDFSAIDVKDSTLTQQDLDISGLSPSTKYFWRAQSISLDTAGAWSNARSFTTILPVPVLQSPNDAAVSVSPRPTLTWNAVGGASTYRVQVSTASDFSSGIAYDDSTISGTVTPANAVGPLSPNTAYYWRVNAKNAGGVGPWSAVWKFTTIAPPDKPVLNLPADSAKNVALSTTVSWSAATGAANYHLQVSNVEDFSSGIVFDDSTLASTVTSEAIGSLYAGTYYFWRVRAINAGGSSSFSGTRSFTTIGLTWNASNGGLSGGAVNNTCFAINGGYMFLGTDGAGVYRAGGSGSTWSAVNSGLAATLKIVAMATTGNNLFAATADSGIYLSTNAGASWSASNTGLPSAYLGIRSLIFDGTMLYAGTYGAGIYYSTDTGANWNSISAGGPVTVNKLFKMGSYLFANTFDGYVYRFNGSSWTKSYNTVGGIASTFAACSDKLFAGSDLGGVAVSPDSGINWTVSNNGMTDVNVQALYRYGSYQLFAGTYSSGVFVSSNQGANWYPVNNGLTTSNVKALQANGSTLFAGTWNGAGVFQAAVP